MGTAERRGLGLFIVAAFLPLETQAVEISKDVAMSVLLGIAAFYFALTTLCMVLVCCACYFNHRPYIVKSGDDQTQLIGRKQCEKPVSPNLPEVRVTKELKPSFPVKTKDVIPPHHHPLTTVGDKTSDSRNWTQHKSAETNRPQTTSTHLGPTSKGSPLLPTYLQQPCSATSSPHSRRDTPQHKGHIVPAYRDSPYLQRPSSATSSPRGIRKMPDIRQKSPRMEKGRLSKDSPYLQQPSSGTSTPHKTRKIPIIGDASQHKGHVVPVHRDSPRLHRDSPYLQQPSSATSSPHGISLPSLIPHRIRLPRDSPYLQRPSSATPSPRGIRKMPDMRQKSPRMRRKAEGHVASAPTLDLSMESPRCSPQVSATDLANSNAPPEIIFRAGVSNPIYEPMEEGVPTVLSLNKELSGISDKWFLIGRRLKVPVKKLNTIRQIYNSNTEKCLMTMFEEWIRMESPSPSWTTIVEVLESRLINEIVLAKTLKTKYCPDESETETEFYTMIN